MEAFDFVCSIGDMAAFLKSDEKRKRQFFFFNNLVCSIEISKVTKKPKAIFEFTYFADRLRKVLCNADGTGIKKNFF